MKVLFVGGFFPDNQIELIQESSTGVIQNAAHAFQVNLLSGFDVVFEGGVDILNLPFIGSYPKRFNKLFFPKTDLVFSGKRTTKGVGFINLTLVKHVSRFFSLLRALLKVYPPEHKFIFIYSYHLPFIAAAVAAKKIKFSNSKICLIVPDLPEYMSDQESVFYKIFKKVDMGLINILKRDIDYYVLLTKDMATRLNLKDSQYIVVEGISSSVAIGEKKDKESVKFVFYSGTLARRYGIRDLVHSFSELSNQEYELWICGDGDSREYIEEIAKTDSRIKYLGQLAREEVMRIQQLATVLVNPRGPEGEYTKYSFPSKVLEYMSSGRPVIMHKLPGIPSEYFDYCYTPITADISGFKKCLENTLKLTESELNATGQLARDFVMNNKSSFKQAKKIKNFLIGSNQCSKIKSS